MANIISSKVEALPTTYVPPMHERSLALVPIVKEIPVIDLGEDRTVVARQLVKALEEYGFFQDTDRHVGRMCIFVQFCVSLSAHLCTQSWRSAEAKLNGIYVKQDELELKYDIMMKQVTNHGVPEDLMDEAMEVYEEFFNLPVEEKENYANAAETLYTSNPKHYNSKDHNYLKEVLEHNYNIDGQDKKTCPSNPPQYRSWRPAQLERRNPI
ncbi:hypothetical protein KY289_006866 [Solanum tuberosum]|nr:hypothetical protein KY289_006866 [Solanum tuberosum]